MKLKLMVLLLGSLFLSPSWALFCPNSFNSINLGDSIDSVTATCGKADSTTSTKVKPVQSQEWVYFIASYPGMPGTLKTTVAFDDKGKVVNISVNGAGVTQTQICGQQTIQFGDTADTIKAACGKPSYINETSSANGAPKEVETTKLQYNASPPVTLIFTDGKLTGRAEN